jgi:uncharacterized membrane protein YdjX (TVP38/TMEM64 family)
VSHDSLWWLCLLLFLDGATFAFATTPLLLQYGKSHEAWIVALAGGAASAAGSSLQLLILRWLLATDRPWLARFAPSRDKLVEATKRYSSATFVALVLARATPLPDAPLKLVAAAAGYPVLRYAAAIFLGALPYYFALALIGHRFHVPTWILVGSVIVIVLVFLIDRWRKRGRPAT